MYHVLFHVIITNEVPVTILQAYISISRRIRKGVLIRRNIASDICDTAVKVASNFEKNRKNVRGELCLNVIILFTIIVRHLVVE